MAEELTKERMLEIHLNNVTVKYPYTVRANINGLIEAHEIQSNLYGIGVNEEEALMSLTDLLITWLNERFYHYGKDSNGTLGRGKFILAYFGQMSEKVEVDELSPNYHAGTFGEPRFKYFIEYDVEFQVYVASVIGLPELKASDKSATIAMSHLQNLISIKFRAASLDTRDMEKGLASDYLDKLLRKTKNTQGGGENERKELRG